MPKISVIMGIYNCEQTLQEALNSLYAQTFQDFEIILCDDGSIDSTYELALYNQRQHPNIILLKNQRNLGLNQTLNNCLDVAKGDYIARMDGDDVSYPERFEVEYHFLLEHPEYAIVSSPMEYFDEKGTFMIGKGHGEVKPRDFLYGSPICHAPCMVRKEAYASVGGYTVDKALLRVEDYHLWFKMYAAGYLAYMLEKPYYKMRDDRNANSRRNWTGKRNQYRVKKQGIKMLGFPWYYQIYAFKPLLVGLLPSWLYDILHKNRNRF